jgi:hypothetical protein
MRSRLFLLAVVLLSLLLIVGIALATAYWSGTQNIVQTIRNVH